MTKTTAFLLLATLFALPGVARAAGDDQPLTEEEMISACVENREKSYECKEPFIDAMIDLRTKQAGKTLTPDERAKMKAKGLEEIAEDGAGPLEPRRAKCAAMTNKMKKGPKVQHATLNNLRRCYAEQDCTKRIACMMPIMAELMAPKKK
jgi:hypothetical protein